MTAVRCPHSGQQHDAPSPNVCAILCLVLLIRGLLTRGGMAHTIRNLRRFLDNDVGSVACETCLESAAHRVALASAFSPGRARCLEQALVLWFILRRRHIAATFHIGVRPDRPIAHAWVEHAGRPIGQSLERIEKLVRLPAIAV